MPSCRFIFISWSHTRCLLIVTGNEVTYGLLIVSCTDLTWYIEHWQVVVWCMRTHRDSQCYPLYTVRESYLHDIWCYGRDRCQRDLVYWLWLVLVWHGERMVIEGVLMIGTVVTWWTIRERHWRDILYTDRGRLWRDIMYTDRDRH